MIPKNFKEVSPIEQNNRVYWIAVLGECHAVIPPIDVCCRAEVEDILCDLNGLHGSDINKVYVYWQPLEATQRTWDNWCKKWSKKTI